MSGIEFKHVHAKGIDDLREEFGNDAVLRVFSRFMTALFRDFLSEEGGVATFRTLGDHLGPAKFGEGVFVMLYGIARSFRDEGEDTDFDAVYSSSMTEIRGMLEAEREVVDGDEGKGPEPD